ncbi:hypothetical protein ACLKA6_007681 [Drosophila palustris]
MRSNCGELPLRPPRRQKLPQTENQPDKGQGQLPGATEKEQLLPLSLTASSSMYSNLRYARTNLSHSSLLLSSHQQSSFDGSVPTSTERTESSETLDTPISTREREREREHEGEPESELSRLPAQSLPLASSRPLLPPAACRRYGLASALHATAKLAASVDAYTAAATANAATSGHCHGDHVLCDSIRPYRLTQQQQQQQQQQLQHQGSNLSRYAHSAQSSNVGSTRYLNYSNLNSNSPHASARRFNAQQTQLSSQQSSHSSPQPPPPPQPRRTTRSSMSQSGEDLHSPTYLSWRKLQLSRAKLKASSKTSALLSGFAMVAMVEVQLDKDTSVPPGMLVAFAICTTLLVAVHMLALMISTCILPNIETVCNLHSISLVHESPHERLHWYIETAWAFSTLLGLILFLVEIAILCWVKFYDLSTTAAWSAVVVLIPVMVIFLAFAVHFYRSLVTHKYEVTVSGIRELEMLKEQMEQDHLEVHNNSRNNGFNYGASGDIV